MRSMVGLSVILENRKDLSTRKVVSKGSMIKPPSSPSTNNPPSPSFYGSSSFSRNFIYPNNNNMMSCFLDCCFLCNQKILPGKDIYMYKGDMAFCSEECRCRQIFMDEDDLEAKSGCTRSDYNCSSAATVASSSGKSAAAKNHRANNNAFAY